MVWNANQITRYGLPLGGWALFLIVLVHFYLCSSRMWILKYFWWAVVFHPHFVAIFPKINTEEILIERRTATFRNICNPFTGYCWWEVFWLQIWHCRNLHELIPTAEVVICGTAVLADKYRKLHGHIGTVQNLTMHKKRVLVPLRDKDRMMQYSVNRCCSSTRVYVTLGWNRGGAQTMDYKQQSKNRLVVKASWWP